MEGIDISTCAAYIFFEDIQSGGVIVLDQKSICTFQTGGQKDTGIKLLYLKDVRKYTDAFPCFPESIRPVCAQIQIGAHLA